MVVTAARTLSHRRYEVTVMMVNPEGGASAAQAGSVELIFESAARGGSPADSGGAGASSSREAGAPGTGEA
jgi:hypothetical protein